jgi:DHA2 family multidrug resistance protein
MGIAMSQLPLINQAVAGLHPKDYATGIGLNNMIRQIGGAFGIAVANNYIARQYAQHRSDLVSGMQNGQAQVNTIAQNIMARTGDAALTAQNKGLALVNGAVERQSYYLAYLDTFRLVGIFFIAIIPLVLFLRVKKKSAEEIAATMKAASEAH